MKRMTIKTANEMLFGTGYVIEKESDGFYYLYAPDGRSVSYSKTISFFVDQISAIQKGEVR